MAALVELIVLASSAVGATGLLSNDTPVSMPSIFAPASTPAFAIRTLSYFVLGICAVIFIVVSGVLTYCVIRFRRRPGDEGREPPQVYGSNQIELAWTVVPLLIVVIMFLATARYIFGIQRLQPSPSGLQATIIGNQWWWEIRYPDLGIVTANELHVPVSDPANPTPVFLTLQSADVIAQGDLRLCTGGGLGGVDWGYRHGDLGASYVRGGDGQHAECPLRGLDHAGGGADRGEDLQLAGDDIRRPPPLRDADALLSGLPVGTKP
jgi:hypothetical protein